MPSFLLAIALAVSPMTSSRQEAAYGPTDLALLFAFAIAVAAALHRSFAGNRAAAGNPYAMYEVQAVRPVLIYWCAAYFMVIISTLANWTQVSAIASPVLQLAGFTVSFLIVVAVYLDANGGGLMRTMKAFNAVSLVILVVYLVGYLIEYPDFFFFFRFKGMSDNPNQTALHMLCMVLVAAMTLIKLPTGSLLVKLNAWINIALGLLMGALTDSDALSIAIAITGAAGIVHLALILARRSPHQMVMIFFVALPLLACLILLVAGSFGGIEDFVVERMETGNQDSDRITLWTNGLKAWTESWAIGNGVGAWSGYAGPFEQEEAHNSIIDWLTITGLVGAVLLGTFFAQLLKRKVSEYISSYYALLAIVAFAMFHFTLRHPIFWFAIVTIYLVNLKRLADEGLPSEVVQGRPTARFSAV